MNKKTIIIIFSLIAGTAILWYLLSPLLMDTTVEDENPLENIENTDSGTNTSTNAIENNSEENADQNEVEEKMNMAEPEKVEEILSKMTPEAKLQYEKDMEQDTKKMEKMDEPMPVEKVAAKFVPKKLGEGNFEANLHDVAGKAVLIETEDKYIVRFENFESVIGPNTRIYLSTSKTNDDFIDLGEAKGNKGNINYTFEKGKDLSKYKYVLVWCKPFAVLFSYAKLN